MKANKAPKKIYLEKEYPDNRILPNGISYSQTSTNIEYTRTDAFIEKAVKYVANHFLAPGMDNEIKDFITYMKGE